ncbi:hypothetical protein B0H19DRAFT_1365127 [Mycena capillaripes]|nr:hypothetical protein B0H19DRAFT_1365127 [Mycena capillaripes]
MMTNDEKRTTPDDEAAAAKLWALYISEAEKYDKSLVESWKSDMEGMLIFAGLFSASLTAFLIESYKMLSPDSGDQTVKLLVQISQQLASSSNETASPVFPPPPFNPSTSSLVCNALWFISLGLSLACALIATLLEQWARDFIHHADRRSAPLVRARIYSYLYYGMKRFNMHVVVDLIPLLLHASLLFFFAGLVAFLIPVNIIMTTIVAILLGLVATAYSVLTCLPLRYMDCPYRTPLSAAFWRLLQHLRTVWSYAAPSTLSMGETMGEAMARSASENCSARDDRALVWTVKSLADNLELEPFAEALAEALRGHTRYADHIRLLVSHRDLQLCSRIKNLYESSYDGVMLPESSNRRQIACYKAFWAISSLSRPGSDSHPPPDFHESRAYHEWRFVVLNPNVAHYAVSAGTMMKWSTFCAVHDRLVQQYQYLTTCLEHPGGAPNPDFIPIASLFRDLAVACGFYINGHPRPIRHSELTNIPQILRMIHNFQTSAPHTILFEYLRKSAVLDSQPYQWEATMYTMPIDRSLPFLAFQEPLEWNLAALLHRNQTRWTTPAAFGFHWNDTAIAELCSFWRPDNPEVIPSCIIYYMNHRGSDAALTHFARRSRITPYLWACFPKTLAQGASLSYNENLGERSSSEELVTSIWALALVDDFLHLKHAALFESLLDIIPTAGSLRSSVSAVALIKYRILRALYSKLKDPNTQTRAMELVDSFQSSLFPTETAILDPETERAPVLMEQRIGEAMIHLLADFIGRCYPTSLPYKAVETVRAMTQAVPMGLVHKAHQIRLATAIEGAFTPNTSSDLMNAIISSNFLNIRDIPSYRDWWLNDPVARETLRLAFMSYEEVLKSSGPDASSLRIRLSTLSLSQRDSGRQAQALGRSIRGEWCGLKTEPAPKPDAHHRVTYDDDSDEELGNESDGILGVVKEDCLDDPFG